MSELYLRLVFSFLVGNSDMHLKNFSLIETDEGSGQYVLSPAYDLLPVNVIMPEDAEEFALTMNGKKSNIRRSDFIAFAEVCGLVGKSAERMLNKTISMQTSLADMTADSLLPDSLKNDLIAMIKSRAAALER